MIHTKGKLPVSEETLQRINREFPTYYWEAGEMSELVSPKFGVITGFQDMLDDLDELSSVDLGEIGPSGPIEMEIEKK